MRSSGFPCRFGGCQRSYPVEDQTSMASLAAASAARTAHEISEHDYHHKVLAEAPRQTSYRPRQKKDLPADAPGGR